jgi:hypothetical protein
VRRVARQRSTTGPAATAATLSCKSYRRPRTGIVSRAKIALGKPAGGVSGVCSTSPARRDCGWGSVRRIQIGRTPYGYLRRKAYNRHCAEDAQVNLRSGVPGACDRVADAGRPLATGCHDVVVSTTSDEPPDMAHTDVCPHSTASRWDTQSSGY